MDDELTQMKAAVEPAIPDIDQAEGLQDLRRRRRTGTAPAKSIALSTTTPPSVILLPVAPTPGTRRKAPFYRDFGD